MDASALAFGVSLNCSSGLRPGVIGFGLVFRKISGLARTRPSGCDEGALALSERRDRSSGNGLMVGPGPASRWKS
jgi:hypothetical protein